MKRREVIGGLVGAALAAPLRLHAQQRLPVVGFLSSRSRAQAEYLISVLLQGLKETGFSEGQNVAIEYRFADGAQEKLQSLAAELATRPVDVIVAGGTAAPAIAATKTIPVVFTTGFDPVAIGYVRESQSARSECDRSDILFGRLGRQTNGSIARVGT